jgi:hypothetical protein
MKKNFAIILQGRFSPSEQTLLFKQLVYRALAEGYFTESKAAELLGFSVANFHQQRTLDSLDPLRLGIWQKSRLNTMRKAYERPSPRS